MDASSSLYRQSIFHRFFLTWCKIFHGRDGSQSLSLMQMCPFSPVFVTTDFVVKPVQNFILFLGAMYAVVSSLLFCCEVNANSVPKVLSRVLLRRRQPKSVNMNFHSSLSSTQVKLQPQSNHTIRLHYAYLRILNWSYNKKNVRSNKRLSCFV